MELPAPKPRPMVCPRCGFSGPPASADGGCRDCGAKLNSKPSGTGAVGRKAYQGDKDSGRTQLQDRNLRDREMECRNSECQAALAEEQSFCTECGTPREETVAEAFKCEYCSLELPLTEAVSNCPRCGTSTGGPAPVFGTAHLSEASGNDQGDDDKGDQDKDGRPDSDKDAKKEVKCPACGASVNLESKKESSSDEHCYECGYSFDNESEAELLVSSLVQSEDADSEAKEIANRIIWG